MKYIYLSLFFLFFCLTACEKNSDSIETNTESSLPEIVPTIEFTWRSWVIEKTSMWHWDDDYNILYNVSIKLMYDEVILWKTNTDEKGAFNFPMQTVPEGAYFLFESPGYHSTVVKVNSMTTYNWEVHMMRNTFSSINGEAISKAGSYITLTGKLQDPLTARYHAWYYITNANNELIGTYLGSPELRSFHITTLPDEELFLHYNTDCSSEGVISLGSYSEDADVGVLLDQSLDFSYDKDRVYIENVYDCSGMNVSGHQLFYKLKDLTTFQWLGSSVFWIPDCQVLEQPVIITLTTQNPRKYAETEVTITPGQGIDIDNIIICEEDDTFIKYSLGNTVEVTPNLFTFANILPDGRLVVKQNFPDINQGTSITFVNSNSTEGSSTGDVLFYIANSSTLGSKEIDFTITINNGEFVEGTFKGEVMDPYEASLGILEGSFRARIQ